MGRAGGTTGAAMKNLVTLVCLEECGGRAAKVWRGRGCQESRGRSLEERHIFVFSVEAINFPYLYFSPLLSLSLSSFLFF
jgi:hypothetical protein